MNELQKQKALALGKCTFPVGSGQKRFAHSMAAIANNHPELDITERQSQYLDLLFHQYRKQIPVSHRKWCDCKITGNHLPAPASPAAKTGENRGEKTNDLTQNEK